MPAYLIVNYDVENPELYGEYARAAGPALKVGEACKLLVMDPKTEQVEGQGAGKQTIVLQFDSVEAAKEAYESGAYQEVVGKRHDATSKHFALLVNGMG